MGNAKYFILIDGSGSEGISKLRRMVLDFGFTYKMGELIQNGGNYFMCVYEDGSIELINRILSLEETLKIVFFPKDYKVVTEFISQLARK